MGPSFMLEVTSLGACICAHLYVHTLIRVRVNSESRRRSSAYKRQGSGELRGSESLVQNTSSLRHETRGQCSGPGPKPLYPGLVPSLTPLDSHWKVMWD